MSGTVTLFFLFSSDTAPSRALIDQRRAESGVFRERFAQCVGAWPDRALHRRDQFTVQFALYDALQDAGVTSSRFIGGGMGQHVIAAIWGA